ncbi:MAG: hypothetical protein HKN85_00850 [Gammaproteobacteria bacterium]|nr:hypothetical protein [Gammaproteobacteria bacterium]
MLNLRFRPADEIIGDNYMRRWHLRRSPDRRNLYLHRYDGSDDDRALHDHPWRSIGVVLWGKLYEVTERDGKLIERRLWPLIPKYRTATYAHRITLKSRFAYSLFFTYPKEREWGFLCPRGWVHWREFTDKSGRRTGEGCGD